MLGRSGKAFLFLFCFSHRPARRFQHQPRFHQQILWLLLQKTPRICSLLSLHRHHAGPGCHPVTWLMAPVYSQLPPSGLYSTWVCPYLPPFTRTCWAPIYWPPFLFLRLTKRFLPQGLCTCTAWNTIPQDIPLEVPSPPTDLCSNVSS